MMRCLLFCIVLTSFCSFSLGDEICDRCVQLVQKLRQIPREAFLQSYVQQICFESFIRCSHGNKFCSLYFLTDENIRKLQWEIESGARDAQVCERVLETCQIL